MNLLLVKLKFADVTKIYHAVNSVKDTDSLQIVSWSQYWKHCAMYK